MAKLMLENIFRFVILILIQVFLFKNIGYYNLVTPFPYLLFILLLPIKIPNTLLFLLAFLTGLSVDVFYDTLGMHAAACVTLAWVRIIFLNLTLQTNDNHEPMATPGMGEMSFRWFFIYTLVLSFIHHFVLFFLEIFSFKHLLTTLVSITFSCIFTVVLIMLFEFLFYKRKKR